MTKEEKTLFEHGIILGFILGLFFVAFCGFISYLDNPVSTAQPNYVINHPEIYTIDTIKTINNTDTTTTYKFRRL